MKEEDLTSVSLPQTSITTTGHTTTNIIFDEAGQLPQFQQQVGSTVWRTDTFISPAEPEGIGALGEIYTDDNGYRFVYTKEGWIQVVNVAGLGLWEQFRGKEEEITKGTKKKLKCF